MTIPGWWPRRSRRVRGEDLVRSLYNEHGASLLAYATRLTNDRAAAEDIVQETLFRAWRNADSLRRHPAALRAWLFRVARNLVVDHMRATRRRPQEVTATTEQVPTVTDHADEVLTSVEVNRALELLSPSHRMILVEVYLRGRRRVPGLQIRTEMGDPS